MENFEYERSIIAEHSYKCLYNIEKEIKHETYIIAFRSRFFLYQLLN